MRITRVVLVLIAMPVIVWLAVSYSNARLIAHGRTVLESQHPTPAQIESALADVRGAHTFADRTESLAFTAALEIRAGRLDTARRIFEQIVRREPENAGAWLGLAQLSAKSDPARAAEARAQADRLDPPGAKRR
jgi:thioredoxin-like negative regulator of GroEL